MRGHRARVQGLRCQIEEQNPETASRWAQLARQGKKVMQFLQQRRYVAVVVDGKVQFYGHGPMSVIRSIEVNLCTVY